MATPGRVGFCLDEACGRPLAGVLRALRAPGTPNIQDVWELGLHGTADDILMIELGRRNFAALVPRDSRILNASVRRDAWQQSGLTLFVLTGKWANLDLFDQSRRLIWWWPLLTAQTDDGPQGAAWQVAPDLSEKNIVRIFGDR